jgi:c(7)-type cytochrome triheme protein
MAAGQCSVRYRQILLAASLSLVACQVSQTAQKSPPEPEQPEKAAPDMTGRYDKLVFGIQPAPDAGDQATEATATRPQTVTESPSVQSAAAPAIDAEMSAPAPPAVHGTGQQAEQHRLYDASSAAYGLLQQADDALTEFPVDRIGAIDWMRALRDGLIAPRVNVRGVGKMDILDQDVIMENTREMPYVQFPHQSHTQWLACNNCHDGIFIAEKGANPMTMNDIFLGKYCGVCHDKVAFSTYACERCHNVPITVNP